VTERAHSSGRWISTPMAKIAIIGSGISGLTCAYLLRHQHAVTLFEANDYLGGHTHTHEIEVDKTSVTVDTGFIVYNDRTYPNFMRLLADLGCGGDPTEMSFSVKDENKDLEYNGHNLNTLFAQRRNLIRPSFWGMVRDILRFNEMAKSLPKHETASLDEYLKKHSFGKAFRTQYLYPMAAAIWSTGDTAIGSFPVRALVDFFINHGLVDLKNRPQWYVVKGGSDQYIKAMAPHLQDIRLSTPVTSIERHDLGVTIKTEGQSETFDEVIVASHSDEALRMLAAPTKAETEVLGAIRYTDNTAYLHTDQSRLPKRRLAWASWNYLIPEHSIEDAARLTYNMNILQHIPTQTQVLVTLNDANIDPNCLIDTFQYTHPFYDRSTLEAQSRHHEISGLNHVHYCGAYWYYGFHEDGVNSALRVCQQLGVDW
jgi:predicted NAD/FAD-binding protein